MKKKTLSKTLLLLSSFFVVSCGLSPNTQSSAQNENVSSKAEEPVTSEKTSEQPIAQFKLPKPQNIFMEKGVIHWDSVPNAEE